MATGVPSACVNNFKEVFDDPHIVARGVVGELEHPRLGRIRATRNPVLLDHDGPTVERYAPMLGEHSEEILRGLNYSDDAIGRFVTAGVIRMAAPATSATRTAE